MKILALESADQACSVAIWQDGERLDRFAVAPRRQALLLLPWAKDLLAQAGLTLSQLDAIAFGQGPGAFTGVRLATSVAQGLAFSADLPVVGVSTLASLANEIAKQYPQANDILALLDARMKEVYLGAYQRDEDGLVSRFVDDCVCPPDSLPPLPKKQWTAGGGGLVHTDTLEASVVIQQQCLALYPQAASVAELGARLLQQGCSVDALDVQPTYLRNQVIKGAVK